MAYENIFVDADKSQTWNVQKYKCDVKKYRISSAAP